jgi:hypothetical protein
MKKNRINKLKKNWWKIMLCGGIVAVLTYFFAILLDIELTFRDLQDKE